MSEDVDVVQATNEINGFKDVALRLQQDDQIKEAVKNLPRAFCVMVFDLVYLPQAGKYVSNYQNYRVLMGKQESIDSVKKILEERVKGSFKIEM